MKYEEFLQATNGMQDSVAERFCALYRMLEESSHPLPVKLLTTRIPLSTRGQINYLLGMNGDPAPKVSEFFQRTQEGYYTLSPVGKQISNHVSVLEEDLSISSRAVKVERTSQAKLTVFEVAHAEAKEELEKQYRKRIEELEASQGSGAINNARDLVKAIMKLISENKELVKSDLARNDFDTSPVDNEATLAAYYRFLYCVIELNR